MSFNACRPLIFLWCGWNVCAAADKPTDATDKTARALTELSADVFSDAERMQFRQQAWETLQARGRLANQRDLAAWPQLKTRAQWERFRDERLRRLRTALGGFPATPAPLRTRVTGSVAGDGFRVSNLVYQTRPGFWVTANLYTPLTAGTSRPAILIAHSHHRPKTQGELQDMGMTWARQGCLVLVIDQVGHGERADHPFRNAASYSVSSSGFRWWRQDYYHRYDTNVQLHLTGQSLMGWMAWDLMRGVDLLLERPDVDPARIILMGSVAGGGDPAAVTAALDPSITAAVPFNFGGPQPETRFPLPADAEQTFNYLGGAYWEGTRNLRRTGADGFFHWLIVGSIAPRPLVYAHEFSWDRQRDPVWKRLNRLYDMYDATDKIDYTLGRGSVKGRAPDATHCTNIGRHHRQRIHAAFDRWFNIKVGAADEYSKRLEPDKLQSMTDAARKSLKPQSLYDILDRSSRLRIQAARQSSGGQSAVSRRTAARSTWRRLLGGIEPRDSVRERSRTRQPIPGTPFGVERIVLETEPGILMPLLVLIPKSHEKTRARWVVCVAQAGQQAFLRQRSQEISKLLLQGAVVCLPDLRGVGADRGSRGGGGSMSAYALLFETPMVGYRLRDLRAVLKYLRTRPDYGTQGFALWGDSFAAANSRKTDFQVPRRVPDRPRFSEPLGGLLALLGAVFEDDVHSVVVQGGLSAFQDVLRGPFVYIPHDVVIPGVLKSGDLPELAAAVAPRPLMLSGLVDGWNRTLSRADVEQTYAPTLAVYRRMQAQTFRVTDDRHDVPDGLLSVR